MPSLPQYCLIIPFYKRKLSFYPQYCQILFCFVLFYFILLQTKIKLLASILPDYTLLQTKIKLLHWGCLSRLPWSNLKQFFFFFLAHELVLWSPLCRQPAPAPAGRPPFSLTPLLHLYCPHLRPQMKTAMLSGAVGRYVTHLPINAAAITTIYRPKYIFTYLLTYLPT